MANHEAEWKAVLDHFFSDFTQQLDKAEKIRKEGGMRPNQMVLTSIDCPDLWSQNGDSHSEHRGIPWLFWLCAAAEERCKTTINWCRKRSAERAGRRRR
ncbi:hypothetical protein DMI70_22310 [Escherichia coli]|nr:hypothetical protein [Escherichia coli]